MHRCDQNTATARLSDAVDGHMKRGKTQGPTEMNCCVHQHKPQLFSVFWIEWMTDVYTCDGRPFIAIKMVCRRLRVWTHNNLNQFILSCNREHSRLVWFFSLSSFFFHSLCMATQEAMRPGDYMCKYHLISLNSQSKTCVSRFAPELNIAECCCATAYRLVHEKLWDRCQKFPYCDHGLTAAFAHQTHISLTMKCAHVTRTENWTKNKLRRWRWQHRIREFLATDHFYTLRACEWNGRISQKENVKRDEKKEKKRKRANKKLCQTNLNIPARGYYAQTRAPIQLAQRQTKCTKFEFRGECVERVDRPMTLHRQYFLSFSRNFVPRIESIMNIYRYKSLGQNQFRKRKTNKLRWPNDISQRRPAYVARWKWSIEQTWINASLSRRDYFRINCVSRFAPQKIYSHWLWCAYRVCMPRTQLNGSHS